MGAMAAVGLLAAHPNINTKDAADVVSNGVAKWEAPAIVLTIGFRRSTSSSIGH
jgi:hypothetical protein